MRPVDRAGLAAPARLLSVDLDEPDSLANVVDVRDYRSLFCLVRRKNWPLALTMWDVVDDETVTGREIVDLSGVSTDCEAAGDPAPMAPSPEDLTVVICTRDRPGELRRCLESLTRQSDSRFSVVVVDNAPTRGATREVVGTEGDWPFPCDYAVEPTPGLSHARNAGMTSVRTPLLAWLDDDEVADRSWIESIKCGFGHPSRPDAVCGMMLPAELETEAQVRFEQYGGFNKGRDLRPVVLAAGSATVRSPLYPLPNFGAGGNMAFRVSALRAIGGFDAYLGAGTRTHGGEETQVFALLLRAGSVVLHWPAAMTWHYHRRSMAELEAQFYGYAAGLSAFYVSMIRRQPSSLWEIMRLVPQGLADMRANRRGGWLDDLPGEFPAALLAANRRGLLRGGGAYVSEMLAQRRRATR